MAISKDKKQSILDELKNILSDSESVTFVNFHGLGVADTTAVRKGLRENEVGYRVAKKTLVKKALSEAGVGGDMPGFEGELALAYGKETAPAREIYNFVKKHEDSLGILGGIFEGKFLDKEEMTEIAQIPSMDVLRGMFVNLINSPIQRLAVVMGQIAEKKA